METWKLYGLFSGLLLGGLPILSSSYTWLRKQIMGVGGSALLVSGSIIILVAMAAFGEWNIFSFSKNGDDWKVELERTVQELTTLKEDFALVRNELDNFTGEIPSLRTQVAQLQSDNADFIDQEEIAKFSMALAEELPALRSAVIGMGEVQAKFIDWGIAADAELRNANWGGWYAGMSKQESVDLNDGGTMTGVIDQTEAPGTENERIIGMAGGAVVWNVDSLKDLEGKTVEAIDILKNIEMKASN